MTFKVAIAVLAAASIFSAVGVNCHPCDRPCVNGISLTCYYKFQIDKYFTLSKACYDCPLNITDCYRPNCNTGTGVQRLFYSVNTQLPGPLMSVCEGDKIVVDVVNNLGEASTSIHWHGVRQIEDPYQDGAAYVTQCPIIPFTTYRYQFNINQPGTYIWHSHSGMQMIDGIEGLFIARQPPNVDPNYNLYDYDLNEHAILINDWHNVTGDVIHNVNTETNTNPKEFSISSILVNGKGQGQPFGDGIYTPVASFNVQQGNRYRFRLCSNVNLPCPIAVTVDNHPLTIIATDGNSVKPETYDSLVIYPGERYDFVINANQTVGNYWIRFKGNDPSCGGLGIGANLKYEASADILLTDLYIPNTDGNDGEKLSTVVDLDNYNDVQLTEPVDVQFYFPFGAYPDYYPLDLPWSGQTFYQPLINGIKLLLPPSPPLSQLADIDSSILCNEESLAAMGKNCTQELCQCVYLWSIPLNAEVEIVLINIGNDANSHDFHLHGFRFYVLAQGTLPPGENTVENFKQLDSEGQIARKLTNPVLKDTVGVLRGGYAIIRFKADNPGFWVFHCHVAFHLEAGMGLVFQVGNPATDFPPVPEGFPKCGNYVPPILP
ncbi:hypothetical protein CHUAL_013382 [Chamberlinius hualienensis]